MLQAERAGSLPLIHRNPIDRLLVAQVSDLGIPIVSVDRALVGLGGHII